MDSQKMCRLEAPTKRDLQCIRAMLRNEQPLVEEKQGYTRLKEDLIAIRPAREPDYIERIVEKVMIRFDCAPLQVFGGL